MQAQDSYEIRLGIEDWLKTRIAAYSAANDYGSQKKAEALVGLLDELREAYDFEKYPWDEERLRPE